MKKNKKISLEIDELTLRQLNWVKGAPLIMAVLMDEEMRVWQDNRNLVRGNHGEEKKCQKE